MEKIQFTPVIVDAEAFALQRTGTAPAITETMQYHADALFFQCRDLVKHIHYPAIVRRIRNIETYKVYYSVAGGIVHKV